MNILKMLSGQGAIEETAGTIGKGIGNVMDRFGFTKKLSAGEKIDKQIELIKATAQSDAVDIDDLKSAREMAIVQMQTQKASWLVCQMNGALRPFACWLSLAAIFNKMWGQFLVETIDGFTWTPIEFSTTENGVLLMIIGFFFAGRQRSKEKSVNLNA